MCLICVDLQKDKLTWKEARNNLKETYEEIEKDHILEILKLIWDKQDEENKYVDRSLSALDYKKSKEYEDIIDLWKTYGGD
jgi:hypothetical protein